MEHWRFDKCPVNPTKRLKNEKLEAYKRLKIPEVWLWEDGVLEIYHLRNEESLRYEKITSSEEIPGIDLELLLRCISMANHVDAVKTFQQAIQK
jgi:Putative restriction endonuclease